jgi:hypothetical protein
VNRANRVLIAVSSTLLTAALGACVRPASKAPPPSALQAAEQSVQAPARRAPPIVTAFVGQGSLEAKGEGTPTTRLALESLAVTARTTGDVAETSVEHVFRNDSSETLEGTFRFPLPEGAILVGLAMEIDGKLVDGELVERDKARKAYEQVVDQMLDPALLEWENGQTFKLRVFPIEPNKDKRVVIRFVAPLHRSTRPETGSDAGLFFAFRPPSADAGLRLERTSITVDGKRVPESAPRAASGEVLVRIAEGPPAEVVTETTKDGAYWLARVRPVLGAASSDPAPRRPQAVVVLCDRSRSMLEARGLQKRTLGMLLDRLGAEDRFTVLTGDVRTRSFGALHPSGAASKAAALDFVDGAEPDGASDVGLLLRASAPAVADARAAGFEPVVVYLGDGVATWGETRPAELERMAREAMGGATMHVVVLGKSTDEQTARALAAAASGRLLRPKTEAEAERASTEIVSARDERRVEDVHVVGADGLEIPSVVPSTLYEGDELALVLHGAAKKPKTELLLVGKQGDRPFSQKIALDSAKPAGHVAQRWAKAKIELFERDGDAHKEEIVKTSLDHGVMSRYTSFLVLDSEEAYARFQIARKAKATQGEASVSGKDLEGDSRSASVSPDHLQPGDPEVRIPAPADAQSVVVVFPFGETKNATFEPEDGAGHGGVWVARFLVDRTTPDGTYEILVRITHKDGRVEILRLPYVVDTQRPNLDVTVTPKHDGSFEIRAKQRLTAAEIEAQSPTAAGTIEQRREQFAHVLTDAKRVEVQTPDGETLSLTHVRLGEFLGTWKPTGTPNGASAPATTGRKLRVVAVDRALNESVTEVEVPR